MEGEKVRIVRGNTASGVYKPPPANFIADVSDIPDLTKVSVDDSGIRIGGAVPIADLMKILEANSELSPSYVPLLNHLKRVSGLEMVVLYVLSTLLSLLCSVW